MRSQSIRRALDEYVARHAPPPPDVWPAVQQQVGAGRPIRSGIHVQATAARGGLLLPAAALVLLLVAVAGLAPWLSGLLPAHPTTQATAPQTGGGFAGNAPPSGSANAPAAQGTDAQKGPDPYATLFTHNLATRLGVDEATLNAAFSGAMNDTADQAVRDGKLDQGAADKFKTAAQSGISALLPPFSRSDKPLPGGDSNVADKRVSVLLQAALAAAPQALGMSQAEYQAAVKAGQSITSIAQARHISLDTLTTALLAAARSAANAQVQSGAWTQGDADAAYQSLVRTLGQVLKSPPDSAGGSPAPAADPHLGTLTDAAFAAGAPVLGISQASFQDAFKQGQTLSDLAQAHQVDYATLIKTMLQAGRQAADAQVQSGAWTQNEADAAYNHLSHMLDKSGGDAGNH